MFMKKIYCVEDDANIRELVVYTLSRSGFEAEGFENASEFFSALLAEMPELVILDIMLPDTDGSEILKKLRTTPQTAALPVIMLTAKSSRIDIIRGLDSGADDYITKPFDIMELVSRVGALLRRCSGSRTGNLSCGRIMLDTSTRTVFADGVETPLTYKEFELLKTLIENRGAVMTRDVLMNKVWDTDFEGESRTVDVHIRTLRRKLGECGECIETVRNVGYKINNF